MPVTWLNVREPGFDSSFRAFLQRRRGGASDDVEAAVRQIVRDVRVRGAEAVLELTRKFDKVSLDPNSFAPEGFDLQAVASTAPAKVREAIDFAAARIEAYHRAQRPADHSFTDEQGVELGWRWTPLDSVGLYAPGGRAAYPSSVLMNAVAARAAGVTRLVMTSPATNLNPAVAYAAVRSGVTEFFAIGGAQAVAALAYGAGPIKPVDKIVGPGNAWVTAAKRLVFGDVGIDTIAGPSEITVVADALNDPQWIAADLLSQAEHDPLAQAILITPDAVFAKAVVEAAEAFLDRLGTAAARQSWDSHAAVVIAPLEESAEVVNIIAPEHVELAVEDPEALARDIRHAGAIFFGRWAPEALGDYVTGSNHVLPTSGAARFASGLSVLDFMKRTSLQKISPRAFDALAPAAKALAEAEGLPAHALSVSIRGAAG
jgi:histidinol dehydrogenase